MASRFCRELKSSLLSSFHDLNRSLADWMEVIATLEHLAIGVCSGKHTPDDSALLANTVNLSSDMLHAEDCKLKGDSSESNVRIRDCQHLIKLLCLMPMGNMSSKSFSLYTTHVLELERYAFFVSLLHFLLINGACRCFLVCRIT